MITINSAPPWQFFTYLKLSEFVLLNFTAEIHNETISKALQLASQSKQAHEQMVANRSVRSCTPVTTPRAPRTPRASSLKTFSRGFVYKTKCICTKLIKVS